MTLQTYTPAEACEALRTFDHLLGLDIVSAYDERVRRCYESRGYDLSHAWVLEERKKKPKKPKPGLTPEAERARLAELEAALQQSLVDAWMAGGMQAVDDVLGAFAAGEGAVTAAEVDAVLATFSSRMGPGLVSSVSSSVQEVAAATYDVGRLTLVESPKFNLIDVRARDWLAQDQLYWIGEHYNADIGSAVSRVVQSEVIEAGLSRVDAAQTLRGIFEPQFGPKSDAYWETVTSSAVGRSRNFGAVGSMEEAGFEKLIPVNPRDEATSPICEYLTTGSIVFEVSWAVAQRDTMLASKTPAAARVASPWLKPDQIIGLSAKQLQAKGVVMAPYHAHCRTIMVVA